MSLRLSSAVMNQVRAHLEAGYPDEACGALVGRSVADAHEAFEFHPMRNVVTDRRWDRYSLDPLEQLHVQKDADARGLEIVGFVHSHPDHPPVPSIFDAEHGWPFYSYVVGSVQQGILVATRSWRLQESMKTFAEELLEVS